MRALTVRPGRDGSLGVEEVPDPEPAAGELLVQGIALDVCGTDREIASGTYGQAPPHHGVPLARATRAFGRSPDDIKTVITLEGGADRPPAGGHGQRARRTTR
ncbi:hypothetical protein ACH4NS_31300 [Streptomyces mutabilis]|uniref:hypothetical protein n=1 Tax=Streptomyces mutabilis TaxID=67332 RepID=UPI0037AFE3FB